MTVKGFFQLLQSYILDPKMLVKGLDIWEIELKVADDGEIKRVSKADDSKKLMKRALTYTDEGNNSPIKSKIWKRKLVNYASIGFGARVGLGFD